MKKLTLNRETLRALTSTAPTSSDSSKSGPSRPCSPAEWCLAARSGHSCPCDGTRAVFRGALVVLLLALASTSHAQPMPGQGTIDPPPPLGAMADPPPPPGPPCAIDEPYEPREDMPTWKAVAGLHYFEGATAAALLIFFSLLGLEKLRRWSHGPGLLILMALCAVACAAPLQVRKRESAPAPGYPGVYRLTLVINGAPEPKADQGLQGAYEAIMADEGATYAERLGNRCPSHRVLEVSGTEVEKAKPTPPGAEPETETVTTLTAWLRCEAKP